MHLSSSLFDALKGDLQQALTRKIVASPRMIFGKAAPCPKIT